ncbi:MAG: tRNA (guanosine(37)-N1)-methyltransferase TrmD [Candidatus Omnitrophota bacterium]|nr:tRNA (guanosine(37)-N1)-methyltransferase TrmD [Candidatus Omnitrophota bacterium]
MRIDIITIFPKMFEPVLGESIIKRAKEKGKIEIYLYNLRDYTLDKHHKVDDRPYGGGSGMVMTPQPIFKAVEDILHRTLAGTIPFCSAQGRRNTKKTKILLLSPQGKKLDQKLAKKLAKKKHLILICGHYEGVDERVRQFLADEEISIGDYVLTGGELPAMVLIDALVRLIPGVLGDKKSLNFESFESNLLEYPQYTRPAKFRNMVVPNMLLSGDHKKIEAWREKEAIKRTKERRPDLLT